MKKEISNWKNGEGNESIEREFEFSNFNEAVEFINKVAKIAELEEHHPDILLHNYKKVKITLTTHKAGGLTEKDFIVAEKINELIS